ncbi:MAG: DUF2635 domain-containing protein [Caulobacter sp.]|nr:DUF2635 domain-containing protein [Caulobacter sp.]
MAETKSHLILKPAEGRRVRHPDGRLLDPAGEAVTAGPYWTRRLKDGDVVQVEPTPSKKPAQKEA